MLRLDFRSKNNLEAKSLQLNYNQGFIHSCSK